MNIQTFLIFPNNYVLEFPVPENIIIDDKLLFDNVVYSIAEKGYVILGENKMFLRLVEWHAHDKDHTCYYSWIDEARKL